MEWTVKNVKIHFESSLGNRPVFLKFSFDQLQFLLVDKEYKKTTKVNST